jgi:hypothetical protein
MVTGDAGERWSTCLTHNVSQLSIEDVNHLLHTALAEGREAPNLRTAYTDGRSAKCECLEYVRAAPDPSVQEHRYAPANGSRNFGQTFQRGPQCFLVSAAMIGDHDAVGPMLHTQGCILARHNAFDDELDADDLAQLVALLPADRCGHDIMHSRHVEPRIHRRLVECVMRVVDVALSACSAIRLHRSHQGFIVSVRHGING